MQVCFSAASIAPSRPACRCQPLVLSPKRESMRNTKLFTIVLSLALPGLEHNKVFEPILLILLRWASWSFPARAFSTCCSAPIVTFNRLPRLRSVQSFLSPTKENDTVLAFGPRGLRFARFCDHNGGSGTRAGLHQR